MTKNPEKSPSTWTYEEALQNFDQFCDYFDHAASARYQSTQSDQETRGPSLRATPKSESIGDTYIDVQTT